MAANYNNSAWFYDGLARMVYGKALVNAQVYLLQYIPKNSKVLIVGGGTGWILEKLAKIHLSGLTITYVEVATRMMTLSQKRDTANNRVIFINHAVERVELPPDFDIVITPFLLDNFTEENLDKLFTHMHQVLKKDGLWLNASFQFKGKWWQGILLKTMFVFFKVICGIEASKLPRIAECFEKNGYGFIYQQDFYSGFIGSKVYRK